MTAVLRFTVPVFVLGAVIFWWVSRTASAAVRRARWVKFATYVVIVHVMVVATILGPVATRTIVWIIVLAGAWELVRLAPRLRTSVATTALLAFAILAGRAIWLTYRADPALVGYVYVLVATFDGFGQAFGQLLGRTKLAPQVSPGKTVEGFVAGTLFATGAAALLHDLVAVPVSVAVALGVAIAVAGLAGDLAASWVKRQAGVKDYGAALPGHGGVLDRFDSFLAAAALISVMLPLAR